MIKKVSTDLDFLAREHEVIDLWKKQDVFRRSIDQREGADVFTFYDGPPTANGKPHIGHILTRAMKDLFAERGAESCFELNPGNHFVDADLRMAKAIRFLTE